MHSKLVEGFCIVSSDSDYTGLANRLREEGLFVMGIGEPKTPEPFQKACDNFTDTNIFKSNMISPFKEHKPIDMKTVDKGYDMVVDNLTGQALASQLNPAFKKIDPNI